MGRRYIIETALLDEGREKKGRKTVAVPTTPKSFHR